MDFNRYVGLPYKDKGRGPDGYDCWGLVRLVFSEQAGITLPSYVDDYVTAEDHQATADLIAGRMEPWFEIDEKRVRPLDGVLMTRCGVERHMGLVVKRGYVLHILPDEGLSRIESYNSVRLAKRVSRFLRHEALK